MSYNRSNKKIYNNFRYKTQSCSSSPVLFVNISEWKGSLLMNEWINLFSLSSFFTFLFNQHSSLTSKYAEAPHTHTPIHTYVCIYIDQHVFLDYKYCLWACCLIHVSSVMFLTSSCLFFHSVLRLKDLVVFLRVLCHLSVPVASEGAIPRIILFRSPASGHVGCLSLSTSRTANAVMSVPPMPPRGPVWGSLEHAPLRA